MRLLAISLLLFISPVVSGQGLTLETFEKYALAMNPSLREANARVAQSAGLARQAGLLPNPSIGYQGEQIRGGAYRGGEQGGFIQQTFPLGGKLGLRRNVYEQQQRADQISVEEQRNRVLGDVDRQFYVALAAQDAVKTRRQLLTIANDSLQTVRQLANIGQAQQPDVLQAEVEREQAQLDYESAQRMFVQELHTLAAIAGKPDLPLAPLAGDLTGAPVIDTDQIVQQILQNSPSVKRAQQEIVRLQAELKSAHRENIPDLDITAGLQNNNEPLNQINGAPVGVQGFVTAGITLPIFNRNQGNIAATEAELDHTRAEVTRVQLSLRQAAQPAIQSYRTAQAEATRYKNDMIPRADRAYHLYLASYQEMSAPYQEVLISQRTLFQLQLSYINAQRNLWISAIALQHFLLSNGLEMSGSSFVP